MEDQEAKAASEVAWFAVKVAVAGVVANYLFGPAIAIAFLLGWWWGVRSLDEDTCP